MKPLKKQATNIAVFSALSTEAKLCFGAAGGCFVLGIIGSGIDALTRTETTLSAFLVISAFYLILGVIGLFKDKSKTEIEEANILPTKRAVDFESDKYADELAA